MRLRLTFWGAVVSFVVGLPSFAVADAFTFIKISDTFDSATPAINNAGTVAFDFLRVVAPSGPDAIVAGVGSGNGGPVTTIADSSGFLGQFFGSAVSINDAGVVSFISTLDAGGVGIFTGSGGLLTPIVQTGGTFSNVGFVQPINNSGTVAFRAFETGVGFGVFAGSGGPLISIASTTGFVQEPVSINDVGTVAFSAGGLGVFEGVFTGNGGPLTPIADANGPLNGPFFPSINNAGTVAFVAALDSGGEGVFTSSNGILTPVADTTGLFSGFFAFAPSINNLGQVAFEASLDAGGGGIFVGPDPVIDKVIGTGDSLFGSAVTLLLFSPEGLNDAGQVAFYAELADGTGVFVRADPVPEPSTLLLVSLGLAGMGAWRRRAAHPRSEP
jgi:PEP-CTERM motif